MKEETLNAEDEKMTRWIDGALSEPERAAWEAGLSEPARHARMSQELTASRQLGALLRGHLHGQNDPPYADFFNSQILKRIRTDRQESAVPARPSAAAGWLSWLRAPWLAGLAGATAILLALAVSHLRPEKEGTRVISVFSPEPNAFAKTFISDGMAVVIDVEGLETFPADRQVVALTDSEEEDLVAGLLR